MELEKETCLRIFQCVCVYVCACFHFKESICGLVIHLSFVVFFGLSSVVDVVGSRVYFVSY